MRQYDNFTLQMFNEVQFVQIQIFYLRYFDMEIT